MVKMPVIVYDVETQFLANEIEGGWKNCFGMKVATCVCYSYSDDLYHFFGDTEDEHKKLLKFLNGCLAITFNGIQFDSQVLLGNDRKVKSNGYTSGTPFGEEIGFFNYDINAEIWKSLFETKDCNEALKSASNARQLHKKGVWNLDGIATATLGGLIHKSGDGALAPQKFKDGKMRELFEYNLQDVRVEKALFEFVKKYKYIINGNYDVLQLK